MDVFKKHHRRIAREDAKMPTAIRDVLSPPTRQWLHLVVASDVIQGVFGALLYLDALTLKNKLTREFPFAAAEIKTVHGFKPRLDVQRAGRTSLHGEKQHMNTKVSRA